LRNIILGLLLANILVLGWKRWIVPPDVAMPVALAAGSEAELVLIARSPGEDSAGIDGTGAEAARCARIGPLASRDVAQAVGRQLRRRDLSIDLASNPGEIWVGHWVQLLGLESEEAAATALNRLVDGGIVDAYIVQTEPDYNISLGVFRGLQGAEEVRTIARRLGYQPEMHDRVRPGTEHWVTVEMTPGQSVDLTDIRLESTQILRKEKIPCATESAIAVQTDANIAP
jgi:hypothetical protein